MEINAEEIGEVTFVLDLPFPQSVYERLIKRMLVRVLVEDGQVVDVASKYEALQRRRVAMPPMRSLADTPSTNLRGRSMRGCRRRRMATSCA